MSEIDLAAVFKALSVPTRLRIFEMLLDREMCVCEIVDQLKMSQPLVSHHLRELKLAGLVIDRTEGSWIFNRLDCDTVAELGSSLADMLGRASREPTPSSYCCEVRQDTTKTAN